MAPNRDTIRACNCAVQHCPACWDTIHPFSHRPQAFTSIYLAILAALNDTSQTSSASSTTSKGERVSAEVPLTVLNDPISMILNAFDSKCVAGRSMAKLNDQISQFRKELGDHLPGSADRAQGPYNLAESLWERFEETDDVANLDKAIALHRSALALRPAGHPNRHWSLFQLAWCVNERYRK